MQRIQVLIMHAKDDRSQLNHVTEEMLRLVCTLPLLHTLHIRPSEGAESASPWTVLVTAPSLTSLVMDDAPQFEFDVELLGGETESRLPAVALCPRLTHLDVRMPQMDSFSTFCASTHMQTNLISLKLELCTLPPSSIDYAAVFSSLQHLELLHLASCQGVNMMLSSLVHAPALHQLTLQPYANPQAGRTSPDLPAVLRHLLPKAPRLHFTLLVHTGCGEMIPAQMQRYCRILREQWNSLVQEKPNIANRATLQMI
jgi:hypothetical protein